MYQPLADLLRPTNLDEVFGQEHILGKGAVLRRLIDSGNIPNMVFYGPSGTGKTTVANIIAKQTNRTLFKLNATTASTSDIKEIVSQLDTFMAPNGVLLYLDEIQSFNKKQQQSLLEHIENGKITLIASTTENPYFYVFNAILSRSTVFEFKHVTAQDVLPAVERALRIEQARREMPIEWEEGVPMQIATACGGDVRKSINAVELLCQAVPSPSLKACLPGVFQVYIQSLAEWVTRISRKTEQRLMDPLKNDDYLCFPVLPFGHQRKQRDEREA